MTAPTKKRWTFHWAELYDEVITGDLCTGCAGCVVACPHDVIGYKHSPGEYRPFHLEEELGTADCVHGQKGCTSCTRACPRFRDWEHEANEHLFGRDRDDAETYGIVKDTLLVRAKSDEVYEAGQDGGLVSAILIWCLENNIIDGALVSALDPEAGPWRAKPAVATTRAEVLATAGSRYTYSANTLALDEAKERGLSSVALVGMGCQTAIGGVMWSRKVGKVSKPIKLNIGLLCSKTFDDSMFEELFWTKYRLRIEDVAKMNIKGKFQVWMNNGDYHEIPLVECHAWTREGCSHCPDFAAEMADISTGGIGNETDWTLTLVRTELGRAIISAMLEDGVIETRPGDDDPGAIALLQRLADKSRSRWPKDANPAVRVGLPVKKKKAAKKASA